MFGVSLFVCLTQVTQGWFVVPLTFALALGIILFANMVDSDSPHHSEVEANEDSVPLEEDSEMDADWEDEVGYFDLLTAPTSPSFADDEEKQADASHSKSSAAAAALPLLSLTPARSQSISLIRQLSNTPVRQLSSPKLTRTTSQFRGFKSAKQQEDAYLRAHDARWKLLQGDADAEGVPTASPPIATDSSGSNAATPVSLGIGFSGGGIRAAAYAAGAAKGLRSVGLWPRIHYMSSVSGGGYTAAAIALAHSSFRDSKRTQDFFYFRSLQAGYCFRLDGTIWELVTTFLRFAAHTALAMLTNVSTCK